jgi:hypothetical protein
VIAVLVAERAPIDASWRDTCSVVGVVLTWPVSFDSLRSDVPPQEPVHPL